MLVHGSVLKLELKGLLERKVFKEQLVQLVSKALKDLKVRKV
jgi:hypothetical protein